MSLRTFALVLCGIASLALAHAQEARKGGILTDGNAVVTGFSGVQPPVTIAPGTDPADKTSIDLAGPSVRVIDLQAPGAPPDAQVLQAAKPFTVTAAQVGQVFGVTIDNADPPNTYVAATSVYGLPIVDANGQRLKHGAPGARFMSGLFGPAPGGPGSIWRIDGQTGEVRLFANVAFDGAPNGGAALGGLAFDPASQTLFVADRATGMIHAFDQNGHERGRYDHGFTGREAANLPQVQFDPSLRANIKSPEFEPLNASTWGYTPPSRRVFGLAVHEGRLYYAVAEGLQVWSVSITPEAAFGTDARIEVKVPPGKGATEIAKIAFDGEGRMYLAERAAPSGAYDFAALAQEASGRVLRYLPAKNGDAAGNWRPDPESYAIGFADPMTNANGGVAIGYGYGANGRIDRNACDGFVWSTGERLVQKDATTVNGVQGNGIDLVRPQNVPPQQSYFVDYDDQLTDSAARGHLGDVAILRHCARAAGTGPSAPGAEPMPGPQEPGAQPSEPTEPQPGPGQEPGEPGIGPGQPGGQPELPPLPPPICPPGTHLEQNALQCCPRGQQPGFTGECQPMCANGSTDADDIDACRRGFQPPSGDPAWTAATATCWNGMPPVPAVPDGVHCSAATTSVVCWKCPKPPLQRCASGTIEVPGGGAQPAFDWPWSDAHCEPIVPAGTPPCPADQQRNPAGDCQLLCPGGLTDQVAFPVNRCCVNGTHPDALGQCPGGMLVPPLWYLHYLATGSGPCIPPNCSFYEFTITGQQRFGRGVLTQRITLPLGSDFGEPRITASAKYCPAARWSCSKSGNVVTCSAEDCGLLPGDKVVLRLEGKVAPNLTEPPPTTIEKTACGVLQWQAMPGRGPAVIEQVPGGATPSQRQRPSPGGATQQGTTTRQETCWTIRIVGRQPTAPPTACPADYAPTADGQCCLRSQLTSEGVCCPAGQRPGRRGRTCVPVSPPPTPAPTVTPVLPRVAPEPTVTPSQRKPEVEHRCGEGEHWNARRQRCVPNVVERPQVEHRCPAGQHWNARRHRCIGERHPRVHRRHEERLQRHMRRPPSARHHRPHHRRPARGRRHRR